MSSVKYGYGQKIKKCKRKVDYGKVVLPCNKENGGNKKIGNRTSCCDSRFFKCGKEIFVRKYLYAEISEFNPSNFLACEKHSEQVTRFVKYTENEAIDCLTFREEDKKKRNNRNKPEADFD